MGTRPAMLPKLFRELTIAKIDGRHQKLMRDIAKTDLLILDDFGVAPLNDEQRSDVLEFMEDRYDLRSTLITSQYPLEHWHELIDAIPRSAGPQCLQAQLERRINAKTAKEIDNIGAFKLIINRRVAVLRGVAALPWTRGQPSRGMSGRIRWNPQPSSSDETLPGSLMTVDFKSTVHKPPRLTTERCLVVIGDGHRVGRG